MKKFKEPAVVMAEKQEAIELFNRILSATDGIPRHVMNGSQQTAAAFKQHASKAREMALRKGNKEKVEKMREAWGLISSYYRSDL